jgi:quinol-cytochrome oxidoreductase complex cytochrome b subunit
MSSSKKDPNRIMLFYPEFLFKEAVAALIVVAVLITLCFVFPMKVGDPADPSDTSFKPRPEWYFMAPFYILKIVPSSLEIIPTVFGPAVSFLLLVLLPFLDRNPETSPKKRPVAIALLIVSVVLTVLFTVLGVKS